MTVNGPRPGRLAHAAAVAAVLVLGGCGGGASSSDSPHDRGSASGGAAATAKADLVIEVDIEGDRVTPVAQAVQLEVGQTLEIDVTSDRSGELHVHSSPEQEFEFDEGSSEFQVTLDKPGSVDVEEHVSDELVVRVLVQ